MRTPAALLLLTILTCRTAVAEDPSARRSITTAGEATVYVVPDEAEISLGVQSYAGKLDDAKGANDKSAAAVVAAIKAAGVDEKKISTDDVTVGIDYDNYSHGSITGYTARRSYVVKVTDIKLVPKIIDAALHNGANELSGVTFNSAELRKFRDQARRMAAKAAREKAADLASQFDAAVGPVRTINESSGFINYWAGSRVGNLQQNAVSAGPAAGGGDNGESEAATPPGQIAVRASITATFDLQDAPAVPPAQGK